MSNHSLAVVRMDALTPDVAERLAAGVQRDLLAAGVLGQPYDGKAPVLAPKGARLWRTGPSFPSRTGTVVIGVSAVRQMVHAIGNVEWACCARCQTELPPEADVDAFGAWVEGAEPLLTCPSCSWVAPYGDWPSDFPSAVGAPVLSFHELRDDPEQALLDDLAVRMGGRTRVVRTRL